MAIFGGEVSSGELDLDKSVAYGDGDSRPFAPIKPGRYTAVIRSITAKTYKARYGEYKNDKDADGKWTYLSLTPDVVLANDNGTTINRQDLTVGVIDDKGNTFRPDGDNSKPSIFGGQRGAQYLLVALGLVTADGKLAPFDTDLIKNRVVVVNVGLAAYLRGGSGQIDTTELAKRFQDICDGVMSRSFDEGDTSAAARLAEALTMNDGKWDVQDIPALMELLNEEEGIEPDAKNQWRVKNVITGFYRLKEDEAVARGYSVLGMQVFLSQNDLADYQAALKNGGKMTPKAQKKPSF